MEGFNGGGGEWEKRYTGNKNLNGRYKIDGEVKNRIGNGETKELIRTTDGHELRWGNAGGKGGASGIKGGNGKTVIA